jgi:hypothetical protein
LDAADELDGLRFSALFAIATDLQSDNRDR